MPLHQHPDHLPEWFKDWRRRKSRLHHHPSQMALHQKPDWWPANEPWPPRRGHLRHNPFFRRLGCLFALFNIMAWSLFLMVAAYVAHLIGLIHLNPITVQWTMPLGAIVFIIVIGALFIVGQALRHSFSPLDSLLDAAERVAEGDYTVRVIERGPRPMRSLIQAFNNMAARLHQTDEQRRNLLADVTHELRTPLTVIQGNVEGMLDGVYPADETNLRSLLDETHLLSRLIDDLRTLALAESGALQLKKEPTDPLLLLRETAGTFQSQAAAAGVALTVTGANLPLISLDPGRMRQVFSNLISNALRYAALSESKDSPSGTSVIVSSALLNGQVQIEVRDSGPGIPAEDLPHVFERFYKSADSGGMGLGLAIARHLVMAHGGTIKAESPPDAGTTIRVNLPIE
jgi:signal transduction histidine kinase